MQIIKLSRLLYTVNTEPVKADYAYLCFIERTAIVGDMFSSASSSCFVREFRLALDICLSIANGEDVGARLCVSVLLYEMRMIMQQNHAALYCRLSVDD